MSNNDSELRKQQQKSISRVFLIVYTFISIATLYHSAYGFGTIDGLPDNLTGFSLYKWWFLGFLCATSVDVGMGAIVYSMVKGFQSKFLSYSLFVLAIFSAYSQLVYSSYFASDMLAITKNADFRPFMQYLLDVRIIVLPLCLPFFSLFYGFTAKNSSVNENTFEEMQEELLSKEEINKRNNDFIGELQKQILKERKEHKEELESLNNKKSSVIIKDDSITINSDNVGIKPKEEIVSKVEVIEPVQGENVKEVEEKIELLKEKKSIYFYNEGNGNFIYHAINKNMKNSTACNINLLNKFDVIRYSDVNEVTCKTCLKNS